MSSGPALFEVSFPYDAGVVPRGARNVRRMTFWGRTSVRVEAAAREDFVEALRIRPAAEQGHAPFSLYGHDGGLWRPHETDTGAPFRTELFAGHASARTAAARAGIPFDLDGRQVAVADPAFAPWSGDLPAPDETVEQVPLREIEWSGRERAEADVHRVAACLRSVDGHVWRRCHEPRWAAHRYDSSAHLDWGAPDDARASYRVERDYFETFRADRLGDLEGWRASLARSRRGQKIRATVGEIDILDASFFSRDDLKGFTSRLDDMATLSLPMMAEASPAELAHWAALRDAGRALRASWSRPTAFEGLAHLEVVREAVGRADEPEDPTAVREFRDMALVILRRAVLYEGYVTRPMKAMAPEDEAALDGLAPTP